jgi:hypothetical protein
MISLLPLLVLTILLHSLAAGIVWVILQSVTKNCNFRNCESSDKSGNRFPWLLSLLLTGSLIFAFLIPGYPSPDSRNYGYDLKKYLILSFGSGIFSLGFWLRMSVKPELSTLFLAIIGLLTSVVGFSLVFFFGAASPV